MKRHKVVAWSDDDRESGIVGEWFGGAYIELFDGLTYATQAEPAPFDVINVYDYAAGAPSISTAEEVAEAVAEYARRCPDCGEDRAKDCGGELRCADCAGPCPQCLDVEA